MPDAVGILRWTRYTDSYIWGQRMESNQKVKSNENQGEGDTTSREKALRNFSCNSNNIWTGWTGLVEYTQEERHSWSQRHQGLHHHSAPNTLWLEQFNPHFPHLQNWDNNIILLLGVLLGLNRCTSWDTLQQINYMFYLENVVLSRKKRKRTRYKL